MKVKKGQEEMVGFALIIILVAVIVLIFLGFSLNDSSESVESYEVESFLQSGLQYTTECRDEFGYLTVQDLVFDCREKRSCSVEGEERNACEILNSTLKGISDSGWQVEEGSAVRGYDLEIVVEGSGEPLLNLSKGNETSNAKGSSQEFSKSGENVQIYFTAYY